VVGAPKSGTNEVNRRAVPDPSPLLFLADNFAQTATIEIETRKKGLTAIRRQALFYTEADGNLFGSDGCSLPARKCLFLYEIPHVIDFMRETCKVFIFYELEKAILSRFLLNQ